MNRIIAWGVIWISLLPGFAAPLHVTFDRDTRYSCYQTYRLDHATAPQASRLFPAGLSRQISGLLQEGLAARGLKPVAKGGDLSVSYTITAAEHPQNVNLSDGVGPTGLGWGNTVYTTTVGFVREWTLDVRIMDTRQHRLVFEGTLSESTSSKPQKNARNLEKAVDRILDQYPPQH